MREKLIYEKLTFNRSISKAKTKIQGKRVIKKEILFGSWAGAFGNFQFMPTTIKNYAVDSNKNSTIELKNIEDEVEVYKVILPSTGILSRSLLYVHSQNKCIYRYIYTHSDCFLHVYLKIKS